MGIWKTMRHALPYRNRQTGQSLVELVLVMVVLVPIMVAVGYTGMAMYQGTMASEAIKEPAAAKSELANNSGEVTTGQLLAMAKKSGNGGNSLDSVSVSAPVSDNTVLIVGRKKGVTIPFFNLTFQFTVAQPIQKNLLAANTAARSSAPGQAPPNLTGKKGPPSDNPKFQDDNLPPTLECSPSAGGTITDMTVNSLTPDAPAATYDSRVTFSIPVKLTEDAVMSFVKSGEIRAKCTENDGICAKELADLQPKPAKNVLGCLKDAPPPKPTTPPDPSVPPPATPPPALAQVPTCISAIYHENPKGAPGQKLEIKYDAVTGAETKTFTPMFGPPHGLYYDPTGAYEKPPADFDTSCENRKYYECVLKGAAEKANQLADEYPCPP